ncbi:hypothetical protein CI109_102871 [Kwoniella shandongensis]|uniref:Uncharacterized protein n=1 Tax=Kwoniella shandongensis TaxID=1734106 RepID=A0A5M6C895_9TREE|nr:uncharacterized protein CI109_000061 [Kwoniella shandongensis]KAA5531223.1 hypothetical protein CI109_000061 [Kwoniella shandongensis]
MAAEPVSVQQQEQPVSAKQQMQQQQQQQQQQSEAQAPGVAVNEQTTTNGDAAVNVEGSQEQVSGKNESELHVACAEGKLEDVRAVLSRGLEGLESLDMNTGCTPIVLAIRGNHHDVVRELLSAGAIVPPPGLTNDPLMLSVLYPQPMYGMPPQFIGMPQEYYPQPPFYPGAEGQQQQQQQRGPGGMFMSPPPQQRKDISPNGTPNVGNPNNLPPADVSKTIPCRNFPNCKYGGSCVFFHPRPQQFYPGPGGPVQNGSFAPNGYEGGYPAPYAPAPGPYYVSNGGNGFNPAFEQTQHQQASQQPQSENSEQQQQQSLQQQNASNSPVTQHDSNTQAPASIPVSVPSQHVPSAIAPVFVPGFIPGDLLTSPPPPSQFGLSPMSPSMLGSSLPSIPPAEAFFAAQSPPNGFMPIPPMSGGADPRRQSFGQQQQYGKPFGHGKKPSFSGGPKPWLGRPPMANGGAKLGSWKDGNPPPCAFFVQGNCRNGEFCKFPHLDAEGNDCRHPDVVRGVLAPLPALPRQSRGMRMMGGPGFAPFDPAYRQQQHQQQMQFLQHQRMAAAQAQQGVAASVDGEAAINGSTEVAVDGAVAEAKDESSAAPIEETSQESQSASTTLPPKPASAAAPMPAIIRSASQPGVQRVHANGLNSRSHSPAPSNVSFHGNGHPRRAGSRVPHMNGNGPVNGNAANGTARSSSAGTGADKASKAAAAAAQRIPRADEFPALGLATPTSEKKEPSWSNGKTAAQVLSAPAPPKPVVVKTPQADEESTSGKSDGQSVTMDSESETDAVIISRKPSTAATPASSASPAPTSTPASAPETKKAPISFASVASAVVAPTLESAPVALKA